MPTGNHTFFLEKEGNQMSFFPGQTGAKLKAKPIGNLIGKYLRAGNRAFGSGYQHSDMILAENFS